MKTTNSKDLVKVNQIHPIMQEHFGQSMNLARIKLMALLLHALCVVQT
ncbi:MAG: IS4 family transposase, partial [Bacteroidales bacterium]|nr:IS4 family transposase [Bacteroidales bacterium]